MQFDIPALPLTLDESGKSRQASRMRGGWFVPRHSVQLFLEKRDPKNTKPA
jgi:hypothetical protein